LLEYSFGLSIILAQIIVYKILLSQKKLEIYKNLASILIIIALLAFSLLSYFPLKNIFFLDPVSNSFGIINN
jgi:hypothetical protein